MLENFYLSYLDTSKLFKYFGGEKNEPASHLGERSHTRDRHAYVSF
jgi:hypothetical protein